MLAPTFDVSSDRADWIGAGPVLAARPCVALYSRYLLGGNSREKTGCARNVAGS
jgi:hypothetical protein